MPINRRTWLRSVAVGIAAPPCARRLSAADSLEEFTFIIVSDTHLGRQDSPTPERQWRRAISEINAAKADFVLHLGDVVDGGRPEQYPLYAEARKTLQKPIYEIPGNHDPLDLFAEHVQATIDRSFDHGGVRWVLFNNSRRDSHFGFITGEQLAWLDKQCEEASAKDLKIVIGCHVPVHKNGPPDRGWYVRPDDGQTGFYEIIDRHADDVLALFHGHFHNGIRGWRDRGRVVEMLCPSVCYNQNRNLEEAVQTGKAAGFFVNELRPGYVLATLGRGWLTLRYKPLGEDVHGEYAVAFI